MNIKCESEIKIEELDLEYNSYQQDSQSFPNFESIIPLPESIKKELDENSSFIKSEPRESDLEFVFNEEKLKNNCIKTENSAVIIKKFDAQHKFMCLKNVSWLLNKVNEKGLKTHFESDEEEYFAQILTSKFPLLLLKKLSYKEIKTLLGDVGERENSSKMKSTSKSRPKSSVTRDQSPKDSHLENLSCRFCNFSFKGQAELKSHLKTHEKRNFKCTHCSYECNSKVLLKQHLLIHSNVKLFKCSECNYECNFKGNFKRYMLIHGNVKLFKCSHCSYECNQKGSLKRHMLIHGSAKLFKCCECNYECNDKRKLKIHLLNHENIKLFKCCECSYECNRKGDLKKHMLIHRNLTKK
ncbi:UNVERIFIED_CONTAM: hypothetical protein RMT77_018792 [Armadillidium vulgare]